MITLNSFPVLSFIIWLPIVLGFLDLLISLWCKSYLAMMLSFWGASIVLCINLMMIYYTSDSALVYHWHELHSWIPGLNIYYHLVADGISIPLIALNGLMTWLIVIYTYRKADKNKGIFVAAFMIMQGLANGVFLAFDAILFYVFFEAMLVPLFLIIGIWGGNNRVYATIKFFLYTFMGSVFFLSAIFYLHNMAGQNFDEIYSFSLFHFYDLSLPFNVQKWLFWSMLTAFAIKIPMWPVHVWLPDAHVEAPTEASVILASITLKIGGYGLLRWVLPITPVACIHFSNWIIVLSVIAIIYIGLIAIMQKDMKKLIAYSSISHMGFVTLGIFTIFATTDPEQWVYLSSGINGATIQMISHGFVSAALFICVGVLYDRMNSREIKDYGGVINRMPIYATFFMLFAIANAGLPGTSAFVGEFLVILSSISVNVWVTIGTAFTLVLSAFYTLWMYKRVIFGNIKSHQVIALKDLNMQEIAVLSVLAFFVLLIGIWPQGLLQFITPASKHLLHVMACTI